MKERRCQDDDVQHVWTVGASCLFQEERPGPQELDTGSEDHSIWVERQAAVQATFVQKILVDLDGDASRIGAAAERCRTHVTEHGSASEMGSAYARAASLCVRALDLLKESGADTDTHIRDLILAHCRHDATIAFLGGATGIRELAAERLRADLEVLNEQAISSLRLLPETLNYPGPSYDPETGLFETGTDADGNRISWRLHQPGGGVEHGVIVGPAGSGKSNLVSILIVEALHSLRFLLLLADPSGRGQLPGPFAKVAYQGAGDAPGTLKLLRGALAIVRHRAKASGQVEPTPERAGLLLVIEECQHVFTPYAEATRIAETIINKGAAAGVALVVTAPSSNLEHFGSSELLRAGLARGNSAVMGGPDMLGQSLTLQNAAAAGPGQHR
ncbi:hypothetical protein KDL01_08280 [Actinospica durhamensis]|uniref:Uncharacterized protein n=1 Tax=Actinospica durhamensis TaxID=1508375 RepID=A0A941EQG2_9ACTN|nr:hypothetical protein [Actinospica durhamensis]MBR7833259.1 hypothetical protein [Actinospica durhamensis]